MFYADIPYLMVNHRIVKVYEYPAKKVIRLSPIGRDRRIFVVSRAPGDEQVHTGVEVFGTPFSDPNEWRFINYPGISWREPVDPVIWTEFDTTMAILYSGLDITIAFHKKWFFIDTSGFLRFSPLPGPVIDTSVDSILETRMVSHGCYSNPVVAIGTIYTKGDKAFMYFRSGLYWRAYRQRFEVRKEIPNPIGKEFITLFSIFNYAILYNEPLGIKVCRAAELDPMVALDKGNISLLAYKDLPTGSPIFRVTTKFRNLKPPDPDKVLPSIALTGEELFLPNIFQEE